MSLRSVKCVFFFFSVVSTAACGESYVRAKPQQGDGIYAMLRRYQLPLTADYVNKFRELNNDILAENSKLHLDFFYVLPILKYTYDGVTIRSTLGMTDYPLAKKIQLYNESLQSAGLRFSHYTADKELWVPYFTFPSRSVQTITPNENTVSSKTFSIFGDAYSKVKPIDTSLDGYIFYCVSGHGGPDPGAIGIRGRQHLYEDEYAYDITLRLARRLIEHGAVVYMIVRDRNDGIRDLAVLPGDKDEYYYGGSRISSRITTRLHKRATIINDLYRKNRNRSKAQYVIIIHVDSRSNAQRIDIFYYYKRYHTAGMHFAQSLHQRVKKEYSDHQPGRGYGGTVTYRNLYMLQHVNPTTVFIEVANIRNQRDQDRLVIVNNRQAVANWLVEGVKDYIKNAR